MSVEAISRKYLKDILSCPPASVPLLTGEAGVAAALAAASPVGQTAGAAAARDLGADLGGEVGRVAGQQAAAVAAAEELAKMNMAEITEEKAQELKATFEELGTRVGSEAGGLFCKK